MKKLNTLLPTVTVAVCAYNEESNVLSFLRSVLRQEEDGFTLRVILFVSDGSTDRTIERVKSLRSKKIKIRSFVNRVGKSSRLNEIYKVTSSDFLVQTDADVIFSHKYVVRDMILPMIHDNKIMMCGGNPKPLSSKTFVEHAVNVTVLAYLELRSLVRGGNNIFSVDGRLLSYRKKFYKSLRIPFDMIANDRFTFFCALSKKHRYAFVKSAIVTFRSPQTIQDQIRQNTRFCATSFRMKKYFSPKLVDRELSIPLLLLIRVYVKMFVRYPLHSLFIYSLNIYTKILAFFREKELTAKWDMAFSTKQLKTSL